MNKRDILTINIGLLSIEDKTEAIDAIMKEIRQEIKWICDVLDREGSK